MKKISIGDTFTYTGSTSTFRREIDDPNPTWPYERIQVTHLTQDRERNWKPFVFPAEVEWFSQRAYVSNKPHIFDLCTIYVD